MSTETILIKGLKIRPGAIFFDRKTIANFSIYKKGTDVYTLNNGNQEVSIRLEKRTLCRFKDTALIKGNFVFTGSKHQFELLMTFLDSVFNARQLTAKLAEIKLGGPKSTTIHYAVEICGFPYNVYAFFGDGPLCTKDKETALRWVDATNDALTHSPNLIEKLKSRPYTHSISLRELWLTKQSNKE